MGGKVLGVATLVVIGLIIADALVHRKGLQVAGNQFNKGLRNTEGALLGQAP